MSEFIIIVPDDWTQFPLDETCSLTGKSVMDFKQAENQGTFKEVSEAMELAGLLPLGKSTVSGVMVINEDRELYMQFM